MKQILHTGRPRCTGDDRRHLLMLTEALSKHLSGHLPKINSNGGSVYSTDAVISRPYTPTNQAFFIVNTMPIIERMEKLF